MKYVLKYVVYRVEGNRVNWILIIILYKGRNEKLLERVFIIFILNIILSKNFGRLFNKIVF